MANTKDLDLFSRHYPVYQPLDMDVAIKVKDVPIWTIHGVDDALISVKNTSEMYEAIKKLGGNKIRYTQLPEGTGHEAWQQVFQNKEILEWLFSQEK